MQSCERFISNLLAQLHNLNNKNNNNSKGLVLLISAMLKKTSPLETFLATTPSHNDFISKAESTTRNCSRWTRNSGVFSIQALQVGRQHTSPRQTNPVSNSMPHQKYQNRRQRNNNNNQNNNIVINPVAINVHGAMQRQWGNYLPPPPPPLLPQQYVPPAFFMHRPIMSNQMMMWQQQTNSNVYFHRNASSGEFSGTGVSPAPRKTREYYRKHFFI